MRQFKVRSSACGLIMAGTIGLTEKQQAKYEKLRDKTTPLTDLQKIELDDLKDKLANPELPQGAKTYCKQWLKGSSEFYNRDKKQISTKYTEKGNQNEDDSIEFIVKYLKLGMAFKNEKHFSDKYKKGTPDVILEDYIIDAKNSWTEETFPIFETEVPDSIYYWQAQCYMDLVNRDNYKLIYTLTDTPKELIEKEAYWFAQNNNIENDEELYKAFESRMTFSDLPDKLRIKIFNIERNQDDINLINERVKLCRIYIKSLIDNFNK